MSKPRRVGASDIDAALRTVLGPKGADFEAVALRMRAALASGPGPDAAADGAEEPDVGGPDTLPAIRLEVLPKGSSVYEVFRVGAIRRSRPRRAPHRPVLALLPGSRQPELFVPAADRADWSAARLRVGDKVFPFVAPLGAPMALTQGPALLTERPDFETTLDAETAAFFESLDKTTNGDDKP